MSYTLPDDWLLGTLESLGTYISTGFENAVINDLGDPAGLQIYEIIMDFDAPNDPPKSAELTKTLVHLTVDDIQNMPVGYGENVIDGTETVAADGTTSLAPAEAHEHTLNFDVGVWASDESGGKASRNKAYQILHALFGTVQGRANVPTGIKVVSYAGGQFITENENDVRAFRVVGAELVVRVYGRTIATPQVIPDQDPAQTTTVTIDGSVAVTG